MSQTPPTCFGQRWEANHPECAGGLDPAYTNPQNGSNRRDRCSWYTTCASRTTANRLGSNQQQVVPVHQLVRPPAQVPIQSVMPQPFGSVVRGMSQAAQSMTQQVASTQARMTPPAHMQPYYGQPAPMMVHPSMASQPWMVPMNYQMPGTQMPSFLTVPEPMSDSLGKMLFFTIVRSMAKAGCWAMANWIDHIPFTPWQSQPIQSSVAGGVPSP